MPSRSSRKRLAKCSVLILNLSWFCCTARSESPLLHRKVCLTKIFRTSLISAFWDVHVSDTRINFVTYDFTLIYTYGMCIVCSNFVALTSVIVKLTSYFIPLDLELNGVVRNGIYVVICPFYRYLCDC